MCGRFYVPEDSEITMLRKVMENLESRNVTVKTVRSALEMWLR